MKTSKKEELRTKIVDVKQTPNRLAPPCRTIEKDGRRRGKIFCFVRLLSTSREGKPDWLCHLRPRRRPLASSVSAENAAASAGINRSNRFPVPRFGGFPVERRVFRRCASGAFRPSQRKAAGDFSSPRPSKKRARTDVFFVVRRDFRNVFVREFRFGRRNRRASRRQIPFNGGATVRFRSAFVERKAKPVAVRPRFSLPRKRAISFPARRVKGGGRALVPFYLF